MTTDIPYHLRERFDMAVRHATSNLTSENQSLKSKIGRLDEKIDNLNAIITELKAIKLQPEQTDLPKQDKHVQVKDDVPVKLGRITCGCGGHHTYKNKAKHCHTNKHLRWISQNQ